jgi:hypothetical protein
MQQPKTAHHSQDAILSTQSSCKARQETMMQGPKRVTTILLCFIVLSSGYLDYWSYSQTFYREPGIWMDVVSGTGSAPSQYRIGVIDTAYVLAHQLHLGMRHTLALLDIAAAFFTVFGLFLVLRRSEIYRKATLAGQWFGAACFVILVQYYLAWLLWYQRPETLPTAAILALALVLLAVKLPLGRAMATAVPAIGLLLLAVAQGFVRADVAFALHVGILLTCLTPIGAGFSLSRGVQAGTSMAAAMLAVGIQYYLMKRVYPHATYGDTPVLQLFLNLKAPTGYIPFLLFMAPVGWTAIMLARKRYRVSSAGVGLFTGAALFMGMWVTVGRIEEVRIFLPFAMAMVPLTVELALQRFMPGGETAST